MYAVVVTAALATPVFAETPDQKRIQELERENGELRQELAQLRLTLSQLQRELKKHAPEDDAEEVEQGDIDPESDSPEGGTEDPESKDKSKPRTFRSADEIYRSISQDMRPARDGWDVVEKRTVSEWLKTNVTGKRFEARKKIGVVKIAYNSLNRIWEVSLNFEHEKMRYMSWDMEEQLYQIVLRGDKDFAEKARKKYKTGGSVNVSGIISGIHWDLFVAQKAEENWHPTHCKLTLDGVQIK